jgi:hypothetical protein
MKVSSTPISPRAEMPNKTETDGDMPCAWFSSELNHRTKLVGQMGTCHVPGFPQGELDRRPNDNKCKGTTISD